MLVVVVKKACHLHSTLQDRWDFQQAEIYRNGSSKVRKQLSRFQTFSDTYHILGAMPDSVEKPNNTIYHHVLEELVTIQGMTLPGSPHSVRFQVLLSHK